jgi:hypothetical protein
MKKIFYVFIYLAILCFVSCDFLFDSDPDDLEKNGGSNQAQIVFDNSNNTLRISVYPTAQRLSEERIIIIEGGQRPAAINYVSGQRVPFFLRYHFRVDFFNFYFDPPPIEIAVPANATTTIPINRLSQFVQQDTFLVNDIYISLKNESVSLINLAYGTQIVVSTDGDQGVNPGQTRLFKIDPGEYRVLAGINNFPFPLGLTFQPGYLYNLEFNGSAVTLVKETPITLGNVEPPPLADSIYVPGNTLNEQLIWLQTNARSNMNYFFNIISDENMAPQTISFGTRNNITLTFRGISEQRTIGLASNGSLFTIGNGITLILDNRITLRGRDGNNASLVQVNSGSSLVMNNGSIITGNSLSIGSGGGVTVNAGSFIMNGGVISGNRSNATGNGGGGGVCLQLNSTFNMTGGVIRGNSANRFGGGVYIISSSFSKTGNSIIYGYNAADVNSNVTRNNTGTVFNNQGHGIAAAAGAGFIRRRMETTAGQNFNLTFFSNGSTSTSTGYWDWEF